MRTWACRSFCIDSRPYTAICLLCRSSSMTSSPSLAMIVLDAPRVFPRKTEREVGLPFPRVLSTLAISEGSI